MLLKTIYIKGFRNFKEVKVNLNEHSLIIGANDVGKTNLIYAIRLLLDRGFSDYGYELDESDFYAYEDTHEIIIRAYIENIEEECILARMAGKVSDDGRLVIQYSATINRGKVEYKFYCGKSDDTDDLEEIEEDQDRVLEEHVERRHDAVLHFLHITAHAGNDISLALLAEETERETVYLLVNLVADVSYDTCTDRYDGG